MGAWTIIWHISFKYWETSRQFARMIRMYYADSKISVENAEEHDIKTESSMKLVKSEGGDV